MTMKTSLSASICRLLHGEQRRSFCLTNGISSTPYSILFNGRYGRVFRSQCLGLQRSRTFSACSEDDFEELGPLSGLAAQFKLMDQKPELKMRNGPKKELSRSLPSLLSIFPDIDKPSKDDFEELGPLSGLAAQFKVTVQKPELKTRNGPKLSRSLPSLLSIFPDINKPSKDDFEELGPPSERLASQFKLMTQKPEHKMRNGPKKELRRSRPSLLSIFPDINKPSKTSRSIPQDRDDKIYGKYGGMKNHSKPDSCSVTADDRGTGTDFKRNGPKKELSRSQLSLSSIFPDIDKPSKTSISIPQDRDDEIYGQYGGMENHSKPDSCSVTADDHGTDFQRNGPKKELSRSQLSLSSIFPDIDKPSNTSRSIPQDRDDKIYGLFGGMKNHSKPDSCSVTADDRGTGTDFKIVTIRIKDIGKETTYNIIHSICKSVGVLEGLAKTEDTVDVFFRVNNDTDSQNIVKRLNGTVIDESQWSAYELPKNTSASSSLTTGEDYQIKVGLQINSDLFEMKQRSAYKNVCLEDLELLHMSVMHLEGLPTVFDPFNKSLTAYFQD